MSAHDTCPCGHDWIDHWLPAPHPCKRCTCTGWWDRRDYGRTKQK
jgi:hypothetical protein